MSATLLFAFLVCLNASKTTPLQNSDRWVVLADADRFGGCPQTAKLNYQSACRHRQQMRTTVWTWHSPLVAQQWETECEWRARCWDALWTATDSEYWSNWHTRITWLNVLRREIGEDAYWAGQMPSPFPSYRETEPTR